MSPFLNPLFYFLVLSLLSSQESGYSHSSRCLPSLFSQWIHIYWSEENLQELFLTSAIPIFLDKRQLSEQPRNLLFLLCFCPGWCLVSVSPTENSPWGLKYSSSCSRHSSHCPLWGSSSAHPTTLLASFYLSKTVSASLFHTEFWLSEQMICPWSINHIFSLFCCPLWTSHTFLHLYSSHVN